MIQLAQIYTDSQQNHCWIPLYISSMHICPQTKAVSQNKFKKLHMASWDHIRFPLGETEPFKRTNESAANSKYESHDIIFCPTVNDSSRQSRQSSDSCNGGNLWFTVLSVYLSCGTHATDIQCVRKKIQWHSSECPFTIDSLSNTVTLQVQHSAFWMFLWLYVLRRVKIYV